MENQSQNTRIFLVGWWNGLIIETEEVELSSEQKANPKTFAEIIDDGLNHYYGYNCSEFDIKYWSLIEN